MENQEILYSSVTSDDEKLIDTLFSTFNRFRFIEKEHLFIVYSHKSFKDHIKIVKIPSYLSLFLPKKIAIIIDKENWGYLDKNAKLALLFSVFLRITPGKKEQYKLIPPDLKGFKEALKLFGIDNEKANEVFKTI